jgi:AI-2 transport protein TqsA
MITGKCCEAKELIVMNRIITFTAGLILVWIIGYLLIAGRSLLIPLVIAIFIWHLLNTMNDSILKIPGAEKYLPNWLSMILSLLVVGIFTNILVDIIADNVNEVIAAAPRYQDNLLAIINRLDQRFHIKGFTDFDSTIKNLN